MTAASRRFRLAFREKVGHGISEEQVWATRDDSANPYPLPHDDLAAGYRFIVAHEQNCAGGVCQVWTKGFTDYDRAKRFLTAQGDQGHSASMFSVLPAELPSSQ